MTKSTKSHLRGFLLDISLSFPALPKREQYTPSCANISSESSDRRQRQKCRLKCTGCLFDFALCYADTAGVPALLKRARHLGCVSVQSSYTPATHFYAGVEPAHTRICSILSCDVFARVVWIKPWGETDLTFLLCPPLAPTCHAVPPATQSRMRKEFKRGKPSSFCPFRTFRTGEKYLILHVLLYDQKYQKSSKTFPLRNLPVLSRFAKARTIHTLLCEHIE